MWTGISALLARAMQMDARKLWTHLFRLAFVIFIYGALLIAQLESLSFGAPGLHFLKNIAWLNGAFIILAGISFFSSAITEEKEERTLGLLQMAGIGPMSVLLGKSTSRLIQALMLLLVQFPFTLLAITLGGVTMHQVAAAYVALGAFMIALANLALFWSVVCRRTGSAAGLTFLMTVVYIIAPFLAMGLTAWAQSRGWSPGIWWQGAILWLLNLVENSQIFWELPKIMETSFASATLDTSTLESTWWNEFKFYVGLVISKQVVTNTLFGVFCFLLARLAYIPCTQDVDQTTETRGMVLRSSSRMKMFSSGRCWGNPLVWKDFHFLTGGYPMAIVKWFAYGGLLFLILALHYYNEYSWNRYIQWEAVIGIFASCLVAFLVIEASLFSARIFHDEIRMQTMSSLLMLPRSIAYIAYSKAAGCFLSLAPAASWLFLCGFIALISGWLTGPHVDLLVDIVFNPGLWWGLLMVSVFLHMTALLSLFVKWGALPLAIFLMLVMFGCMCPMLSMPLMIVGQALNEDRVIGALLASLVMIGVNATTSFVLQMMIGARLQEIGSK